MNRVYSIECSVIIFVTKSDITLPSLTTHLLQKFLFWGLTLVEYWKVMEVGSLMTGELATEAPGNNNRNYNGPKVEKFFIM